MRHVQTKLALGQLLLWLFALGILAFIANYGYRLYAKSVFINEIETHLMDAKIRLNSTLQERDKTATYGDVIKQCEDNAAEISNSLISIKKLGPASSRQHYDSSLKILVASRNALRSQKMMAEVHVKGKAIMSGLDKIATGNHSESSLKYYKETAGNITRQLYDASKLRLESLEELIDATKVAQGMFRKSVLIDIEAYSYSLQTLKGMQNKPNQLRR